MADSREYRARFFTGNFTFLGILFLILVAVYLLSDLFSGGKVDLTADKIYTISPATKDILRQLKDKVTVNYYCSEDLPEFLQTLRRDTKDTFDEFHELSDGNFQYSIINPEAAAQKSAEEQAQQYEKETEEYQQKLDEYDSALAAGRTGLTKPERPKEPKPPQSIQDIFGGRQQKTDEQIYKQRQERASAIASQSGQDKETVERNLLVDDYKRAYFQRLEQRGIGAFPITERQASSVRQVRVYSSIEIKYLDKEPEVIPVHYSIESLEYEIASRILKVTTRNKPVVAFFDGRKPPMPEMNPMNPMQRPPVSDYEGIINFLKDFFEVRSIAIKEGDSFDDLARRLREDATGDDAEEETVDEDEPLGPEDYRRIKSIIIAQPDQLETRQVYEINRMASLGIPTVFLVSPYSLDISEQGQQQGYPLSLIFPGLNDMFRQWGVEFGREVLASNSCGSIMMRTMYGGLPVLMDRPLPVNVAASGGSIDQESPLTNRIRQMVFPTTTGMRLLESTLEKNGIEFTTLASTTDQTWSVAIDPVSRSPMGNQPVGPSLQRYQQELVRPKDPEDPRESSEFVEPKPLAVLLKGKLPFTFQGETIPEWPEEPEAEESGPAGPGGLPGGLPGVGPFGDRALRIDGEDPLESGAAAETPPEEASAAESEPMEADPAEGSEAAAAPVEDASPGDSKADAEGAAEPPDARSADDSEAEAEAEAEAEPKEDLPKADLEVAQGTVLVLASVDMLKNEFLMQRNGDYQGNIQLFQNVLDTFGLGNKLIDIQRKQLTARQFEEGTKGLSLLITVFGIAGVPALVGVVGIVFYVLRRRESIAYERTFVERN